MKILFQNRANAYSILGGDTVVMQRLEQHLTDSGIEVSFNADPCCRLFDFDVVHAFNTTLCNGLTDQFAQNAVGQGKPFLVTSLQEDTTFYFYPMMAAAVAVKQYILEGQKPGTFPDYLAKHMNSIKNKPAVPFTNNPMTFTLAHWILTNAESESKAIRAYFPSARLKAIPFGSQIKAPSVGGELFEKAFGVSNFVFCVGRLEGRKNQLMLLKAFEEEDIPLVFADSNTTCMPEYSDLCHRFKRRGKTVFTGRISEEMLVSAYRAARVHCLPSFWELPGLVSLEAALYGCNVVASTWGSIKDYLGPACFYCEPDQPESIRAAVLDAMNSPKDEKAKAVAAAFTWERFGDEVIRVYESVKGSVPLPAVPDVSRFAIEIGNRVRKNDWDDAFRYYDQFRKHYSPGLQILAELDRIINDVRARLKK